MEYIKKQDLIDYLIKEGYLKEEIGFKKVLKGKDLSDFSEYRICRKCGGVKDERDNCYCEHNNWVDIINSFDTIISKENI